MRARSLAGTITALLVTSTIAGSAPALAQDDGSAAMAAEADAAPAQMQKKRVEEIVVTARKRAELEQEVPMSLTVLSQQQLASSFNRDITDIEGYAPNVLIAPVRAGPGGAALSIRGISFQDIEKSFDPAVGVLVDDIFVGTNTTALLNNFDIGSLEVLRGPQGTLFGKNTIGGAIRVTRTRPTGEFGAKVSATLGGYGRNDFRAVLNAPITDWLAAKFWAFSLNDDGFVFNEIKDRRVGGQDYLSTGVEFLAKPTDEFQALLTYEYIRDRTPIGPLYNASQPAGSFDRPPGDLLCTDFGQCAGEPARRSRQNFGDASSLDLHAITAKIDYDIEGIGTISSITGWRGHREAVEQDFDTVEIDFFSTQRAQEFDQVSEEIRFVSNFSDRIDLVAGLYLWWSEYTLDQQTLFLLSSLGLFPDGSFSQQDTKHTTYSIAPFFQTDVHITDWLTLTAGLRYTYEEKELDSTIDAFVAGSPIPLDDFRLKDDWDGFTPVAGLNAQVTDDILTYFTYSRGFRSGGFNGRALRVEAAGPYDPEFVDNFEIGMKSDWLDGRARLNMSLFWTDYDDKQEETVQPAPPPLLQETVVQNASKARIRGIEVELTLFPMEGLMVRQSVGLLDADFTAGRADIDGDLIDDDFEDFELRRAPDWQYSIFTQYSREVGPGTATVNLNWRWVDNYHTTIQNYRFGLARSHGLLDAMASYSMTDDGGRQWRASVFGRNLTDETYTSAALGVAGLFSFGALNAPTTWGIEASVQF